MAESNNQEIMRMTQIYKSFPGVQALENVDFCLRKGEIHALVGENGAGKSTLIKVITGVERFDKGTLIYDGRELVIKSPLHAQNLGISTVYQEVNLCANLSVAENLLLGREPRRFGTILWGEMNKRARQMMQELDVDIDVSAPLAVYSTAIQQITAIARALEISSVKVLILDEPTSSLDAHEANLIFQVMRKLRNTGVGIIFVTHFLKQIYDVSDRITVLRNGKLVGTYDTASLPKLELVEKMIGRSLAEYDEMKKAKLEDKGQTETLVEARNFGRVGSVEPMDLDLRSGEVIGLAGLLGSGRTEVARLLFGVDEPDSGTISIGGETMKKHSPLNSIIQGLALCPEDRKQSGIVSHLTIRENIILAMQARLGWFKFLSRQKQDEIAQKYIKLLNILTPSSEQLVKNLSGGNQQKVILARWLATNPRLLILDEPTRGIDVGTKAEIQKMVISLATEGMSCVFISSELEEVMRTSNRIVVMRDREKVTEFPGDVAEIDIMQAIAGGE